MSIHLQLDETDNNNKTRERILLEILQKQYRQLKTRIKEVTYLHNRHQGDAIKVLRNTITIQKLSQRR